MKKINIEQLRRLILDGITSEELNSEYDYSHITNMGNMFYRCSNLESIPKLDTSNVTDMGYMFSGCSNLESIPKLDTSNVKDMFNMFSNCSNLESIDIDNFRLYDFSNCNSLYLKEKHPEYFI